MTTEQNTKSKAIEIFKAAYKGYFLESLSAFRTKILDAKIINDKFIVFYVDRKSDNSPRKFVIAEWKFSNPESKTVRPVVTMDGGDEENYIAQKWITFVKEELSKK